MRELFLFVVPFLLSGCVKYVYVPVSVCPKPPVVVEQTLKTDTILPSASTDDKLLALVYDVTYLKSLKERYKILLNGYNEPQWQIKDVPIVK